MSPPLLGVLIAAHLRRACPFWQHTVRCQRTGWLGVDCNSLPFFRKPARVEILGHSPANLGDKEALVHIQSS